jgi:hypothetical protein
MAPKKRRQNSFKIRLKCPQPQCRRSLTGGDGLPPVGVQGEAVMFGWSKYTPSGRHSGLSRYGSDRSIVEVMGILDVS